MTHPLNYKIEKLVKDESVKRALRHAIEDDGKLSYEEVRMIIYNACDGNTITNQEISDLKTILESARSLDERTKHLIRDFLSNPTAFLKFRDFPADKLFTITNDLLEAKTLASHCANFLVLSVSPSHHAKVSSLVRDTFGVRLEDRNEVSYLQQKFRSFGPRMDRTTFVHSKESAPPGFMQEAAQVRSDQPFRIYIHHHAYFGMPPRERAALLIHEYIHHVNNNAGHPGGVFINFMRTPINLQFSQAKDNPYCYQYFALWSYSL